uniref:DNA-directed primase/polymerase protein n=1 Tax=Albugo laibachii Nc14 TaxID=890382 RepID=F0WJC0_9STRA|nr:conserved hypothetical protein [Albugo laibachii Nc14]|eukprot:CCA21367.1 conserved hypothetical protein [Albugo laibachii Nc14]
MSVEIPITFYSNVGFYASSIDEELTTSDPMWSDIANQCQDCGSFSVSFHYDVDQRGCLLYPRDLSNTKSEKGSYLLLPYSQMKQVSLVKLLPDSYPSVLLHLELPVPLSHCFFLFQQLRHARMRAEDPMTEFVLKLHRESRKCSLNKPAKDLVRVFGEIQAEKAREALAQRRTISPDAFYTAKPSSSDGKWHELCDKLHFSITHSLQCQVDGSAPVSAVFLRQSEAFDFAERVRIRRRKQLMEAISLDKQIELIPKVFSFEDHETGRRQFIVTTLPTFWQQYCSIASDRRHVYEIIPEDAPCRLYFDLEFSKILNHDVNGDRMTQRLLSLLRLYLYCEFFATVENTDIIELDSSTDEKFSRHLVIRMPHDQLFRSNLHVGYLVRHFVQRYNLHKSFSLRKMSQGQDACHSFIDLGVYTRNRMFRIVGSSKFGKVAILRFQSHSKSVESITQQEFCETLVCPVQREHTQSFLRCDRQRHFGAPPQTFLNGNDIKRSSKSMDMYNSSMFPRLDAFIRSISQQGGVQGEIRMVQCIYDSESKDGSNSPDKMIYHMAHNRFCHRIQHSHKSNHIMWIVDTSQQQYYQKCHDPECHASSYAYPRQPLPSNLLSLSE